MAIKQPELKLKGEHLYGASRGAEAVTFTLT